MPSSLRSGARLLLVCMLSFGGFSCAWPQQVDLVVSSQAGDRLTAKPPVHFLKQAPGAGAHFEIHEDVKFQTMDGFGASFLESGMMVLRLLPPKQQEDVLRSLFDVKTGAGFSAMKTVIGATDFMPAGPFYTYDDVPGDVQMTHFSIARDLSPDGLITYIKRARRYGSFKLEAPMDYPPDWMLFDVNTHQDVDPKYYDALSLYYLRYLQEYEKNGVFIDYLSLFNEPGIYTKIHFDEINQLLRDHVGPLLARSGTKTQIIPSEANERLVAYRNFPTILGDPASVKYVGLVAFHGYDFGNYDKLTALRSKYPQFHYWMTELCYDNENLKPPKYLDIPRFNFDDGDFWGDIIFNDVEASASAWIFWNMILDEKGGPFAISPVHGNPSPNYQNPVVIIDRNTKKVTYTGLYYYLAHFSKFVRPGAVRIEAAGGGEGIRILSFKSPEGKIVTELMNRNKTTTNVNLVYRGSTLPLALPGTSITTAMWPAAPAL